MIDWLSTNASIVGLLFFFIAFSGVALWAYRSGAKKSLESHKYIPLKED